MDKNLTMEQLEQTEIPTLDLSNPITCLDLEIQLYNRSGCVRAEPIPKIQIPVSEYIQTVMPGAKIEFLGRKNMLCLDLHASKHTPTSLFFETIYHCYQNHLPLALRPEVLMYLIVNEVATTVNLYPDDYRHLFTDSREKTQINIRHDKLHLGNPDNPWHEVLAMFNSGLRQAVPDNLMDSFMPRFSTATQETMAASIVAFMSAARQFYDYHLYTRCGLPKIRLLGNPTDYTRLHQAAKNLSRAFDKHLGEYFDFLLPILGIIEQQARGAPVDEDFWKSMYQYHSMSGMHQFNGWISGFINYIQIPSENTRRNRQTQEGTIALKKTFDWNKNYKGIDIGSVPAQISFAPFSWHYRNKTNVFPMQFVGGVLGIDNINGFATPALSYAIVHSPPSIK